MVFPMCNYKGKGVVKIKTPERLKSKLRYRHAELGAVKVRKRKQLGMVRPDALFSLSSLLSGKGKEKTSFLFFSPIYCNRMWGRGGDGCQRHVVLSEAGTQYEAENCMREGVLGRILACSKALCPERVCYQEGAVWPEDGRSGWEGGGSGWSWGVMDNFRQVEGGMVAG